jgi:hypothetical protein
MTHVLGVGKSSCHISIADFQPNFLERWDLGNERKRAGTSVSAGNAGNEERVGVWAYRRELRLGRTTRGHLGLADL